MHPVVQKTFGGLSPQYYFRHLLFGFAMGTLVFFMSTKGDRPIQVVLLFFTIVSTALYPYSRYVYESVIDFVVGNNIFFVNAILVLFWKSITMFLCWFFALIVAPIGLAFLYYQHSRSDR